MTTQPSDWAVGPKFCEWLRGIFASERNPYRDGMYVRTIRRTGRCNPGTYYELTDGKGNFWQYPRESVIRLDRARELDASGGGEEPVAWIGPRGDLIDNERFQSRVNGLPDFGDLSAYRSLYLTPRAAEAGEWIDRCARAAQSIIDDHLSSFRAFRDPMGYSRQHLRWMCEELAGKRIDSETKACRWLGYVQGTLVSRQLSTLDAEKARNLSSAAMAALAVGGGE